mmetsp:Transcript_45294/g.144335  ORF Transcript_45294/g.144335 Transcript_45294/m.144335 type:complete len:175 (-) Transcript_45294:49-573(-)
MPLRGGLGQLALLALGGLGSAAGLLTHGRGGRLRASQGLDAAASLCKPRQPLPVGNFSFFPDNGMACLEGNQSYLESVLARLQQGPLRSMYAKSKVGSGSCKSRKYGVGECQDHCFPHLRVRMRLNPKDGLHMMRSEWDLFKTYSQDQGLSLSAVYDQFRGKCDADHQWTFQAE